VALAERAVAGMSCANTAAVIDSPINVPIVRGSTRLIMVNTPSVGAAWCGRASRRTVQVCV